MPIPIPVLDDLSFDQLMAEARALIPRYAPGWTDHNISDPGIMLLELFAWLSGTFMFRADQVTDKHIETFLNLIGQDKSDSDTLKNAVINAALSIKDRKRAITENDYEYLAMKQMNSIHDGLGGRAAVVVNRNLDLEEGGETESIGHTSVLIFPNDPITIDLYEKIRKYVESGISPDWSKGESLIVKNIDDLRRSRTTALFTFIDSSENHLYPLEIRSVINTMKTNLVDAVEKYLNDGIRSSIDNHLSSRIDLYMGDLIDKIRIYLNDKNSVRLPQIIVSYIEHRKECIVKRFIKLLRGKPSKKKVYDDNAERIREEIRKNVQHFLDTGDSSWTTDDNLIEELSVDLIAIGDSIANHLLHKEHPIQDDQLHQTIEAFRNALIDAVRAYVLFNTVSSEFVHLINALVEYKSRLKQSIEAVLFPEMVVTYPVELPDKLVIWLKNIAKSILSELYSHVIDAIENEVQTTFDATRLLTHRVHVIQPVRYPVGIRITVQIQKTAIWANVRPLVFRLIKDFLDPINGGPSQSGWPIKRPLYSSGLCQVVEGAAGVDHVATITLHTFIENNPGLINEIIESFNPIEKNYFKIDIADQIKEMLNRIDLAEGNDTMTDQLIESYFSSECNEISLLTKRYFVPLLFLQEQREWL